MIITDIIEIKIGRSNKKSAYKIYIDYDYAFLLYRQDLKEYKIEVGREITLQIYDKVIEDTVYRRARQKAMAILKHMDRTEKGLYDKLKEAYYTDIIIDRAIAYLKDYNYINDERYASNYIRIRKETMSKFSLKTKLIQKGINKDILEKIIAIEYDLEADDTDPEILALNKAIHKKYNNITDINYEDRQKLKASLYRKGFDLDKINSCLK